MSHSDCGDFISHIGDLALQVLEAGSGSVIAVFNNSLYLSSATHELCCIGTSALVGGPINIRTNLSRMVAVDVNSAWHCANKHLTIGENITFEYSDFLLFEKAASLEPVATVRPDANILKILQLCLTPDRTNGNLEKQIEQRLRTGTVALSKWLQSSSNDIPDEVTQLLGCGKGLTPSGDDVLIGALITLQQLNYSDKFSILADHIQTFAPARTNQISLAHLKAACLRQAVKPLHDFVDAVFGADIELVENAINTLKHYGHSSGVDAMRGVAAVVLYCHYDE